MEIVKGVLNHWNDIAEIIASIIGIASVFIRVFPRLDKNNKFLPIIKFIGKWVALNNHVSDDKRPTATVSPTKK